MQGIIIGAGIGGLATALALHRRGIRTRVFESAAQLAPVGAGIVVQPNAMTLLNRYGLAQQVREAGWPIENYALLDAAGATLSNMPAHYRNDGVVQHSIAIHRGALQQILRAALPPDVLVTAKRCIGLSSTAGKPRAHFADGSSAQGEFLVGADGIHSTVRGALFPAGSLRYSGQTCWRGVAQLRLSPQWRTQLTEVWDRGRTFGFVPIDEQRVYWFATRLAPAGGRDDAQHLSQQLIQAYQDLADPIAHIIRRTAPDSILRNDLHDLAPLKSWCKDNAVLLGDAAHAAMPNLGQGGAQAIEDSWCLAQRMSTDGPVTARLREFAALRMPKAHRVVNNSRQLASLAHWSNGLACRLRKLILRATPASVLRRQSRLLYQAID